MPRAVHRLQPERPVLAVRHEEHLVLELLPVARRHPGLDVVHERRLHLDVAALQVLAPAEVLEHVPDDHALGVPERHPRRVVGEVEEVELRPQPAVVAALRLLEALEVRVEVGLRVEGRAVDARQLLVVLVAAPVRAGEARQLDRLDRLRVLEMRAAAEVGEVALRVERDVPFGRVDELDLVVLALVREELLRLPRPRPPRAPTSGPRRARAGSRLRSSRAPPRRSAPGTRSRSRSRSRSAGRSRSSSPG